MTAPSHHAGAPSCGSCGYDTTGLLSLTCPECGADLRVAGITRGRSGGSYAGFFVSAVALLVPWVVCGMILASFVSSLVPARHSLQHSTRLGGPRSGAYQGVDVAAAGTGWQGERASVTVELQLRPRGGTKPPAPLPVGANIGTQAVLEWMAAAGIDTRDPRVRDEAQAVTMSALRILRKRHRFDAVRSMTTSFASGTEGPFDSVNTTAGGGADRSNLPVAAFGVVWVGALVAGVTFLWRTMRPRPAVV
jgi:hypothetical protein